MSYQISDPRVSPFLVAQQRKQIQTPKPTPKKTPQKLSPAVVKGQQELANRFGITTFDLSKNVTNVGAQTVPVDFSPRLSEQPKGVINPRSPDPSLELAVTSQLRLEQRDAELANLQQQIKVNKLRNLNFGVAALQGAKGQEVPALGKDLQQRGTSQFISDTLGDVRNPTFTFGSTQFAPDGGLTTQKSTRGFLQSEAGRQQIAQMLPPQQNILESISQRQSNLGLTPFVFNSQADKIQSAKRQATLDLVTFPDGTQRAVTPDSARALEERGIATIVATDVPKTELKKAKVRQLSDSQIATRPVQTVARLPQVGDTVPIPQLSGGFVPVSINDNRLSTQIFAEPSLPQAGELEPTRGGEPIPFLTATFPREESVIGKVSGGFAAGLVGSVESIADPITTNVFGQTVRRQRDLAGPLGAEAIFGGNIGLGITSLFNLGQPVEVFNRELGKTATENIGLYQRSGALIQQDPFFQIPTVVGAGTFELLTAGAVRTGVTIGKEAITQIPKKLSTLGSDIAAVVKSPTQPVKITKQISRLENTANTLDKQNTRLEQILEKQLQGKRPSKTDENFLNKIVGRSGDKSPANIQRIIATNTDVVETNRATISKLKSPPKVDKSFEELVGGTGRKGGGATEGGIDDAIRGFTKNIDEQEDTIRDLTRRFSGRKSVRVGSPDENKILPESALRGVDPEDVAKTAKGSKQTTKQLIKPDLSETRIVGSGRSLDDIFGTLKRTKKGKKGTGKGGGRSPRDNAITGGVIGAGTAGIIATGLLTQPALDELPDIGSRFGEGGIISERIDTLPDQTTDQIPSTIPITEEAFDVTQRQRQRQRQRQASAFPTPNPQSPFQTQSQPQVPRIGLLQLEQGAPPLFPRLNFPFFPLGSGGSADQENQGDDQKFFRVFASAREPFGRTELPLGEFVDSSAPIQEISDVLSAREILEENRLLQNPLRAPRNIVDEENFENLFNDNEDRQKRRKRSRSSFIFDSDLFKF